MYKELRITSIAAFLIVGAGTYVATQPIDSVIVMNEKQNEVATLKSRWLELSLDNYQYTIWRGCMFSSSHVVTVHNSEIRYSDIRGGSTIGELDQISDIFDDLIEAYGRAKNVDVTWDDIGYPTSARIDWTDAIDDECSILINDFVYISKNP